MDSKGYPPSSQAQYGHQYGMHPPQEPPPQYNQQYGQQQYGQQQPFGQPQPPYGQQMHNVTVVQTSGVSGTYQSVPHDYTTQAFIACLCCFWPTGIFAIMKANESRDALAVGDYARAHSAADSARTFVRISYGFGIASIVVAIVIVVIYVAVIAAAYNNV